MIIYQILHKDGPTKHILEIQNEYSPSIFLSDKEK